MIYQVVKSLKIAQGTVIPAGTMYNEEEGEVPYSIIMEYESGTGTVVKYGEVSKKGIRDGIRTAQGVSTGRKMAPARKAPEKKAIRRRTTASNKK